MSWWVYLLRCGDGTLYTGITDDLDRRLAAHNAGRGAKYTRSRPPGDAGVAGGAARQVRSPAAGIRRQTADQGQEAGSDRRRARLCRWCFKTFTAYGAETKDVRSASDEPLDLPKF